MAETLLYAVGFAPMFLLLVWLMCHIGARQAAPRHVDAMLAERSKT